MAGYKRVNFYELCRLCATNQQKEKTHIFEEEGRKIQLQTKIQSCLSLKVCENDFLPKVVCAQCLRSLEECYTFRNECVNSESMLSSYFNNFRYTEDFKKSGKVYIKDTGTKPVTQPSDAVHNTPTTTTNINNNVPNTPSPHKSQEHLYYVQTIATNERGAKQDTNQSKIIQLAPNYNVNVSQISCPTVKTITTKPEPLSSVNNITVNSNGEIINLGSISDIEALIAQNMVQKLKQVNVSNKQVIQQPKRPKQDKPSENVVVDNSVLQIDLTVPEVNASAYDTQNIKFEKLPHIKATSDNSKFMYTIKIDDGKQNYNQGGGIVLNQINHMQNNQGYSAFQTTSSNNSSNHINTITPSQNMNLVANYTAPGNIASNVPTTSNVQQQKVKINSNVKMEGSNQIATNVMNSSYHIPEVKSNLMMINNQTQNISRANTSNVITSPTVNITNNSSTVNYMNISYSNSSNNNNNNNNNNSNHVTSTTIVTNSVNNNNNNNNQSSQIASDSISQSVATSTASVPTLAPASVVNQSPNSQSAPRLHICDVCQKVFKRREHLNQHIKLHTGYRPFICESCNKSFMRKEHLLRHMTSHSGQKNFTCNICEKSFSRNDNLLKHKKTHEKQGKYTCEYCQKTFVMKHYYLAHKMTHEPEQQQKCVWNVLKV